MRISSWSCGVAVAFCLCAIAGSSMKLRADDGVDASAAASQTAWPVAGKKAVDIDCSNFGEGWRVDVEIPESLVSQMGVCSLWVEGGWLWARRQRGAVDRPPTTFWQVVLAKVREGELPTVNVVEDQPGLDVSYAGGRYFVRDTFWSLRVVREPKTQDGPFLELEKCAQEKALSDKGQASNYTVAAALRTWEDKDWFLVALGPYQDKFDCFVRLNPNSERGDGDGVESVHAGLVRAFHGETWIIDDGEMLVAARMLPEMHAATVAARRIKANMPNSAPPEIDAAAWLNVDKPLTLAAMKGKPVLIDFWATWCGPCVDKLERMQKLHDKYGKLGLQVVAVHLDNGGDACAAFAEQRKLSFPIAIDSGKTAEAYAVDTVPCYFLIGADGKVVSGYSHMPPTDDEIEAALAP